MEDFFNIEKYFTKLKTRQLGKSCVFKERVESTIDVASSEGLNTLVVAREQTKGRGQRTNVWVSPPGCAMGSIRIAISKTSPLSRRLCFLQHIVALSAAWTLEKLDKSKLGRGQIKLKWPNDLIYLNNSRPLKIGGVLVNTQDRSDNYDVILSFGLNVFNREPTTCVSDIIGTTKGLGIDSIVAEIMNFLEEYTYSLDDEKFERVKFEYTERCLQMGTIVHDEVHGALKVREVDEDGYLVGESCSMARLFKITKIVASCPEKSPLS